MKLGELARALLPPVVGDLLRSRGGNSWSGDFNCWADATAASGSSYDEAGILDRVEQAALKVKRGEAVYERDGVVFEEISYSWPLLSGLMWAAAQNGGHLDVLDFGGALGSSYFQNRHFLSALSSVRWNVVEQPHFVERGRRWFADEQLRFHPSVDDCFNPNQILVLSSVLQYLQAPYRFIDEVASRFRTVIVDLTPMHDEARDRLTVQTVPENIYPAKYPCWFFSRAKLLRALEAAHVTVASFHSHIGTGIHVGRLRAGYQGMILRHR